MKYGDRVAVQGTEYNKQGRTLYGELLNTELRNGMYEVHIVSARRIIRVLPENVRLAKRQ